MGSGSEEIPEIRLWRRGAGYQNSVVGLFVVSGLTKRHPYADLVKHLVSINFVNSMSHVPPEERARHLSYELRTSAEKAGEIKLDASLLGLALCKRLRINTPGSAISWTPQVYALESWVCAPSSDVEPMTPLRVKLGQAEGSVRLWPEQDSPYRHRMKHSLGAIVLPHPLVDSDANSDIVGIVRVGAEDGLKGWPLAVHQHPDRTADDIFEQFVTPDVLSL
jgi:hypothetical protein